MVFTMHLSFDAVQCASARDDHLMDHLVRLEQSYQSRLPPSLASNDSHSFALNRGLAAAKERISNLFDAKWRKKNLSAEHDKAVFRALSGPNPRGMCWKGWRRSGFGETQVSGPRPAIREIDAIVSAFRTMWGRDVVCEAVPMTILRPPDGAALDGHIDSGSMLEMYVACRGLLIAGRASALDWAVEYGCQALIHWEGALPERIADKDGGHTCGLSQLTIARYMVLLSMMHPDHVHEAIPPPKTPPKTTATRAQDEPKSKPRGHGEPRGPCKPTASTSAAFDPHAVVVDVEADAAQMRPRASSDPVVARFLSKGGPVFAPFSMRAS